MLKPCKKCGFPKCVICWDKGYSTEMVGNTVASADFIGERDRIVAKGGIVMHFCSCERGKQLEKLIQQALERRDKELIEKIESFVVPDEELVNNDPLLVKDYLKRNSLIREFLTLINYKK